MIRHELRLRDFGYRPYAIALVDGREMEFISYPFRRSGGGYAIMVREPGDPTTMAEYTIPDEAVDLLDA